MSCVLARSGRTASNASFISKPGGGTLNTVWLVLGASSSWTGRVAAPLREKVSPLDCGAGSWYANVPVGNMRDVAARDRS